MSYMILQLLNTPYFPGLASEISILYAFYPPLIILNIAYLIRECSNNGSKIYVK